jgi:hypothetical protein
MSQPRRVSFIVRVVQDPRGRVRGVVERVATGSKHAFDGGAAIGRVIVGMLRGAGSPERDVGPRPPSDDKRATTE